MIDKILEDREKRYNIILDYLQRYNLPVVCAKINYPGIDKNTKESRAAFEALRKAVFEKFESFYLYNSIIEGHDGKSFLGVVNMSPLDAKNIGIDIEESHELGRVFDIDVYIGDGTSIGRETIKKNMRKCVLCGEDARICIKTGAHTLDETLNGINKLIGDYGVKYENRIL